MSKTSTYDPALRQTESGRRLYGAWKRVRKSGCDPCFNEFPAFYKWALFAGYVIGDKLYRYDDSLWYSPENCYWSKPDETEISALWAVDWCEKWNKTVNVLRRYFGLPEF